MTRNETIVEIVISAAASRSDKMLAILEHPRAGSQQKHGGIRGTGDGFRKAEIALRENRINNEKPPGSQFVIAIFSRSIS